MLFNSQIFLFWFLPAVLVLYFSLPFRWRSGFLALASYVFYGAWRVDFVALMLASTVLDYFCGKNIGRLNLELDASPEDPAQRGPLERSRKRFLLVSIVANLSLLGYFKYWGFGVESLGLLLESLGYSAPTWSKIVLPVGISFYTFQSLSYSIDVYRREAEPVKRFVDFACYIALFPQLVAGPIVRYQTLAKELVERTHTFDKIVRGAFLFQVGFAKKILLADTFAVVADQAFALDAPSTGQAWLGTLAYSLQIYFDFSGYSDMAIGLGAIFGFTFPLNFNSPYRSVSITDFWRRWHISLSSWLRDYLYVPLGGNRGGPSKTYRNLMLTMLLGGLWHGAAFTFILWGAYHGAFLAMERMLGKRPFYSALPKPLRVAATFVLVMGGWVLFRANSVSQAGAFFRSMAGFGPTGSPLLRGVDGAFLPCLGLAAVIVWFVPTSQDLAERKWALPRVLAAGAFLAAVAQMFVVPDSPFLYFQF